MIERISARKYCGEHAAGSVVLVDGQPVHVTGPDHVRESRALVNRLIISRIAKESGLKGA